MVFMEEDDIGKAFSQPRFEPPAYAPAPKKRTFIPLLLVVIAIAGIFFGARQFLGSQTESEIVATPTPTPIEEPTPTEEPEVEETPTPQPSNTPTPKPTANPIDKVTGLDRSELSIAVQNGSGEKGVASQASDFLKNLGYHILTIGNADNFSYEKVTIEVKQAKSGFLPLLKNDLSATYTIGTASATLSATSSADALIIVGQ